MIRDGYVARWRGREYEASPDGDELRLYTADPAAVEHGFVPVAPGRYRRSVPATEAEDFRYVRTACVWRGEPFIVVGERPGWLRLEYTGGRGPTAARLGLEAVDYAVYQAWARPDEVTDVREERI